ncbi:Carboxyl-terminal protease [Chitinispirillum alkaliphilum]|nr:Carboxyl-terminal protease [Chitinispirillum alkaliphilum]
MKKTSVKLLISWLCFSATIFMGCDNPAYVGRLDITEHQSVWQHLKVYSIYQDRVPNDPFVYNTTQQLFNAIDDWEYTRYFDGNTNWGGQSELFDASKAITNTQNTVFLDTLTESTVSIEISAFRSNTHEEFLGVVWKALPFDNIVIDLRGNQGGDLRITESIIEEFLPPNTSYIKARYREYDPQSLKGNTIPSDEGWEEWRTTRSVNSALRDKNFSVLIDSSTASASEILAAALKDCLNATLIGQRSYGKGIGQIIIPRRNRRYIRITFLKLRGISDRTGEYNGIGIYPDNILPAAKMTSADRGGRNTDIYHAVKALEPSIQYEDITFPPERGPKSSVNNGLFKVTSPDPLNW